MDTSIAVIIATYNWPEALTLCARSIFRQTLLPDEIIIADDGSGESTRAAIEKLKKESPRPVKHLWQEDRGFRKSEILNEAILEAKSDYIIQVDGDCIFERHFVEDHMSVAKAGCFVCGSRVKLPAEESSRLLKGDGNCDTNGIRVSIGNPHFTNSLRIPFLKRVLAGLYGRKLQHLRGCNMAFWRDDLLRVNGYDENLQGWGHEDQEIAWRLKFAGVRKRVLKFGGICYHLDHKELAKDNEGIQLDVITNVRENRLTRCENGIDRHMPNKPQN